TKNDVKTYVSLQFGSNVTEQSVQSAIVTAKRSKVDKLCVFVGKTDASIVKTAQRHFSTSFVDVANAYALLEQADKLPDIPQIKQSKNSFIAKYAFCRKRFGWYFASSLFLTLISIVAYMPYYTLGWATVMLALSLYSAFNTRFNTKSTNLTLD
ncbi:MAG: hypothetical protein K2M64_02980, partial [Clostridia bacterium]|nr:hypothetical protein [Clostridia bacterium]